MNPKTRIIKELMDFRAENPDDYDDSIALMKAVEAITDREGNVVGQNLLDQIFPKQKNAAPQRTRLADLSKQVEHDLGIPLHAAMLDMEYQTSKLCDDLVAAVSQVTPSSIPECRELSDAVVRLAGADKKMLKFAVRDLAQLLNEKGGLTDELKAQYKLVWGEPAIEEVDENENS